MKTIGLIGGMSWESTQAYYRLINARVNAALGGLHSARILLYSVDFAEIEECQAADAWDRAADILADAGARLEVAGADFLLLCTNTMHKVAPAIAGRLGIPLLHIADVTAQRLRAANITKVGLLGTKYTMTQDFYTDRLKAAGIEVLIPAPGDIEQVNTVIFKELCQGVVRDASRRKYLEVIDDLQSRGARGVILGCTEIGMLVGQEHSALPVFDTTLIHAQKAADLAVGRD